jgi:HrpA-like RNA helicase
LQESRRALPIYEYKDKIIDAVRKHRVTILVGETGSGKTTREWLLQHCRPHEAYWPDAAEVPQYIYEAGLLRAGAVAGKQPPSMANHNHSTGHAQQHLPAAAAESHKQQSHRPWQLVVTQPRRVAAVTVARRVASEMGTAVGGPHGLVAHAVRFDDASGPATR